MVRIQCSPSEFQWGDQLYISVNSEEIEIDPQSKHKLCSGEGPHDHRLELVEVDIGNPVAYHYRSVRANGPIR